MINILLKKDYNENKKGDIISVSNNVAFGLVESGTGVEAKPKDFAVKTPLGETKAFKKAPSTFNKPHKKETSVEEESDTEETS